MEKNKDNVEFVVNKTYFIDDTLHLSFKFNEQVRAVLLWVIHLVI